MPNIAAQRDRQGAIRDILTAHTVRTQPELLALLERQGVRATQSSVSRDLRSLCVAKLGGRYVLPATAASSLGVEATPNTLSARPTRESRSSLDGPNRLTKDVARLLLRIARAGPYMLVVTTPIGAAAIVGVELDRLEWPEVVGTIAGDDTVFVACDSPTHTARIRRRLLDARR